MKILLNRYLLILIFIIAGLVSCNNDPSCSIVTTSFVTDENDNCKFTDFGKPNISIEKKDGNDKVVTLNKKLAENYILALKQEKNSVYFLFFFF